MKNISDNTIKTAIVAGGNGKVGQSLVLELVKKDYFVIVIGRAPKISKYIESRLNEDSFAYFCSSIRSIDNISKDILDISPAKSNHLFFNLAWRGRSRLTDGTLKEQVSNIASCGEWVGLASSTECRKFVSAGTIEETIVDTHLCQWPETPISLESHKWYAFSKLYAFKTQRYLCYKAKIEHIHAQIGVVLGNHRNPLSYVDTMLCNIANDSNAKLTRPNNREPTIFSSSNLIGKQLVYIAENGKNHDCFRLGSEECGNIEDFLAKTHRRQHQTEIEWEMISNVPLSSPFLAINDVISNLPAGAPTESLDQMLEAFFS